MNKTSRLCLVIIFTVVTTVTNEFVYAQSAENAWTELVGKRFSQHSEFTFVEHNKTLPNVLLYGDSISIGYSSTVREALLTQANVYRIHLNGGDASSFISKMTKMHNTMQNPALEDPWLFNWDVIHFNVGLHDLKYLNNKKLDKTHGKQVSTIKEYKNNLKNIVVYLKKIAPNAKLIFATTTPIPSGEPGRIVGDAAKYNAAALEVMKDFSEVAINDLYTFTKPNHKAWWQDTGNVHYNKIGKNAQGTEVARNILAQLSTINYQLKK